MPARTPHRSFIRPTGAGVVLALLASTGLLASCGGSSDGGSDAAASLGSDQELQHLTCDDWEQADGATRDAMVSRLTEILGGQVTGRGANGSGSVLDDAQAHGVFDHQCAPAYARAFVLYKLYALASGFAGGAP